MLICRWQVLRISYKSCTFAPAKVAVALAIR
jgi:hypothetical protein